GFTPMTGQRSGIRVYGDQRGAATADYDGDGRPDLVVTENGAATVLLHNRGATPGIRVRLQGPPANPEPMGASLRRLCGDAAGPLREIQSGSGYWSRNSPVEVLGRTGPGPCRVETRWPGGRKSTTPVAEGAREVRIAWPAN